MPGLPRDFQFYGRRVGRKIKAGRRRLLDERLPGLRVTLPLPGQPLTPAALFGSHITSFWLEIGFGGGEHLVWQALHHRDVGFIGCEPFITGVAGALGGIAEHGLTNVRIFDDDARLLMPYLPAASISRCFLLFPDPWPKTRHHKRRFISPDTLRELARILSHGAELRVGTDDPGMAEWALRHIGDHRDFTWLAKARQDWLRRPDDWPATRYEQKAVAAGRVCIFLRFRRDHRKRLRHRAD